MPAAVFPVAASLSEWCPTIHSLTLVATWAERSRVGYGAGLGRLSHVGDWSGTRNVAALGRSDNVADCGHAFAGLKRDYLLTKAIVHCYY